MAENTYTPIDNVLVRPQYLDTFRRSEHLEPEKSLLAAILEDAVEEYRKYSPGQDPKSKRRFREVEERFNCSDTEWIFSFDNICELLGVDPDYIRHRLPEIQGKPAKEDKHPVHHDGMHKQAA